MPSVINIALKPRITEESLLQLGFKRTIFFEGVIQFVEDLLSILADTKVIGESVRVWIRLEHLDVHCTVDNALTCGGSRQIGPRAIFCGKLGPGKSDPTISQPCARREHRHPPTIPNCWQNISNTNISAGKSDNFPRGLFGDIVVYNTNSRRDGVI